LSISQESNRKNVVSDALSRLDIDSLKIQEEEVLSLLSGSEKASLRSNSNAYCLDLQRARKNQGTKRKGLSPTSLLNTTY
jgi:hypothetical protein